MNFFSDKEEIVDDVFGCVGELFVKYGILCCDVDGIGV